MLEKPAVSDDQLTACLQTNYDLPVSAITFLPLGADIYTAVYRVLAEDGTAYFVKLRRGRFDPLSVELPMLMHRQGIAQIIAPITTRAGQLWAHVADAALILYPFVAGHNGWDTALSPAQWRVFGQALRRIHALRLPSALHARIPREQYTSHWRDKVRQFQARSQTTAYAEPYAAGLADLLKTKRPVVDHLIQQAETLAARLQTQPEPLVVCHADIHRGNLLITPAGTLYIVDWDQPVLAPKERDLMFIGAGIGAGEVEPEQEEALFYAGYGAAAINRAVLTYYRCERIVQDIAAYAEQLLLTEAGGDDRPAALANITSQFEPGAVIDIALQTAVT